MFSLIDLVDIEKVYQTGKKSSFIALRGINLKVEKGECWRDRPIWSREKHAAPQREPAGAANRGHHRRRGQADGTWRETIAGEAEADGMIFQHFNLLTTATVRDNIAFPLPYCEAGTHRIKLRVDELLELVGLTASQHHYPKQLSGGQSSASAWRERWRTNLRCCSATRRRRRSTRRPQTAY